MYVTPVSAAILTPAATPLRTGYKPHRNEGVVTQHGYFTERHMTPPPQEDQHRAVLAFNGFYRTWYSRGVGYAMRAYRMQQADAEEASSDAMASVYAMWGATDNPAAMFRTILRRRIIDHLRVDIQRRSREAQTLDDEAGEESLPRDVRDAVAFLHNPETMYTEADQHKRILGIINSMPMALRTSLVLAAEGYTTSERAEIKGVSEGTERSHLHRARMRFQELLLTGLPQPKKREECETKKVEESAKEGEGK
ncbi:sigma-70 family RNA polymerase sigma factor [Streptomyces hilarionis]|uniref:sigma-70 family RNA polymerase sigma factor n=1 Tax=Streptomyces hilarionis TaxID=2839954 RepID=UPI002119E2E0|nr:sigma-70 family RNA polymerase sigma factor [Streptomyces hilarionis]MCQ9132407.1 sigma-70 family RNA polymerase sigma factor [Streptomyces hilarionis]